MGKYGTKAFFASELKKFSKRGVFYFEIYPATDCCPRCEEKANKKLVIATATKEDYPPFHRTCRCSILPLDADKDAGALASQKAKYASGELPYKRCCGCQNWIAGNAVTCDQCAAAQE